MTSPMQWTWTWANSKRWWGAGKPGVLQCMGLQRAGQGGHAGWLKNNILRYTYEIYVYTNMTLKINALETKTFLVYISQNPVLKCICIYCLYTYTYTSLSYYVGHMARERTDVE